MNLSTQGGSYGPGMRDDASKLATKQGRRLMHEGSALQEAAPVVVRAATAGGAHDSLARQWPVTPGQGLDPRLRPTRGGCELPARGRTGRAPRMHHAGGHGKEATAGQERRHE